MSFARQPKRSSRDSKPLILIVCEGEKTEKYYFEALKKHYQTQYSRSFKIESVKKSQVSPVGIVTKASERIQKLGSNLGELSGSDQAWCVFDKDHHTEGELLDAKALAEEKNIKIAYSNPCFEIWFYLHFISTTREFVDYKDLEKYLKKEFPSYQKNKCCYKELQDKQTTAIKNAKKLFKHHLDSGQNQYSVESNPSTNVHELVDLFINY